MLLALSTPRPEGPEKLAAVPRPFVRDTGKNDITVPYPYQWNAAVDDLDTARASDCPARWEDRNGSRVFWRGYCTGPVMHYLEPFWQSYTRYRITELSRAHNDTLDAGLSDRCVEGGGAGLPPADSMRGMCHHKFAMLVDGAVSSGRSSLYFHAGAVLLKHDSVYSEWSYTALRPWVHYVPVREFMEDAAEQAEWVTRGASPGALKCLRDNLEAFANQHINKWSIAAYWWRVLTAYKRQQSEDARTAGFSPA